MLLLTLRFNSQKCSLFVIPVCHFIFALDYVNDRFLPGVPSKPFLAVCHWSVSVLPFSQTSLVMVTLKAHGFNKNYSLEKLLLFNVELLFQLTFSFSLGWKLFWSLNCSFIIAKEFGLLSQNIVSSTLSLGAHLTLKMFLAIFHNFKSSSQLNKIQF